jgi:hypothetical protein
MELHRRQTRRGRKESKQTTKESKQGNKNKKARKYTVTKEGMKFKLLE